MSLTPRHAGRTARRVAVALLGIVALPSPARAETSADVENARAFFVEATRLGKAGRWKEAREFYARSLVLKPAALTHYSLGVAQRETGHLTEALGSFRTFLADPSAAAKLAYEEPARTAIAELEARIGHVELTLEPSGLMGLSLTIDGQPVPPQLQGPREIDPGAHEIVLRAPGFRDLISHFSVVAGSTVALRLVLSSTAAATASRFSVAYPAAVGPRAVVATSPVSDAPPPSSTGVGALPIALLASGGALFAVGLAVGLVGVKEARDAPSRTGPEASAARTKATAGDVIASVGAVTAGVGLVVLLASRPWATPEKSAALATTGLPWPVRF